MILHNRNTLTPMIDRMLDRIRADVVVLPLIALFPFTLVAVLVGKILPAVNPRLGSPAETVELTHSGPSGQIYISVSIDGDELVAVDGSRRIARWPINADNLESVEPLTALLKKNVYESVLTSSLSSRSFPFQTRVVLAVDRHLRYAHVKPILYAMAEAKVSQYAFETRAVVDEFRMGSREILQNQW